jgi:hypothetical protein
MRKEVAAAADRMIGRPRRAAIRNHTIGLPLDGELANLC